MCRIWLPLVIIAVYSLRINAIEPWADPLAAQEWCAKSALEPCEGYWEFPEDGVKVIIIKQPQGSPEGGTYRIVAVYDPKDTFEPGQTVGILYRTTDPLKFKMRIRKKISIKNPLKWVECVATLGRKNQTIDVETRSLKLSINPLGLLPGFWKIARLRVTDPTTSLPHGLIRLAPSYDGNGSSFFSPRYL